MRQRWRWWESEGLSLRTCRSARSLAPLVPAYVTDMNSYPVFEGRFKSGRKATMPDLRVTLRTLVLVYTYKTRDGLISISAHSRCWKFWIRERDALYQRTEPSVRQTFVSDFHFRTSLSTHYHKHHTIFNEPALHFSLFGIKKAKYDENNHLESLFSKRSNFWPGLGFDVSLEVFDACYLNTSKSANAGTPQPTFKYIGYVEDFVFVLCLLSVSLSLSVPEVQNCVRAQIIT